MAFLGRTLARRQILFLFDASSSSCSPVSFSRPFKPSSFSLPQFFGNSRFSTVLVPLRFLLPEFHRILVADHRCFSTRPTTSSLNEPAQNWSNRPPKETILLDGCDFEHWLVVMEPPPPEKTRDDIIDGYIKTLAMVVGSEEEARMKIYSVSTKHYYAFSCLVSEELSYKIKPLPNVRWVLPDSYLDVKNKSYGGEPFIDGQAVPYDPKYHEEWVRNNARANERSRRNDKRNFDRSRNFERRRENMQNQVRDMPPMPNRDFQTNNFQNSTPAGEMLNKEHMNRDMPNRGAGGMPNQSYQNRVMGAIPNQSYQNRDMGAIPNQSYQNRDMGAIPNQSYQNRDMGAIPNQSYQNRDMGAIPNQSYQNRDMGAIPNQSYQNRDLGAIPNQNYQNRDMEAIPNQNYQNRDMPRDNENRGIPTGDMGGMPGRDYRSRDMPSGNYQ